jgi:shikimate dehydrogenase
MGEDKGRKKTYGLMGRNIGYSLSPLMHNSAFRHFGINSEYKIFDAKPSELRGLLDRVAEGDIGGMNITVPYKVDVMDLLLKDTAGRIEEFAVKIGAVNTIRSFAGGVEGFNTDGAGFAESLRDDLGFVPERLAGEKVLVLGAGGAGRAVSFYLLDSEYAPAEIFICDTDKAKAGSLSRDIASNFEPRCVRPVDAEEAVRVGSRCALIVNATPLGTKSGDPVPFAGEYAGGQTALYDLVYARQTELVKLWKEGGGAASGGLGMLVNQAVLAFNIWTEAKYDIGEIKSVMRASLPKDMRELYGWSI